MTHHHGERRTAEYVSQFSSLINLSALEHWSSSEKYVHRVWPQICKPLPVLGKFKLQWASTPTKLLDMTDNLPTAGGVVKIGWTSCSSRWVAWATEVLLVAESLFRLLWVKTWVACATEQASPVEWTCLARTLSLVKVGCRDLKSGSWQSRQQTWRLWFIWVELLPVPKTGRACAYLIMTASRRLSSRDVARYSYTYTQKWSYISEKKTYWNFRLNSYSSLESCRKRWEWVKYLEDMTMCFGRNSGYPEWLRASIH